MPDALPTALAIVAVALFAIALAAMTVGSLATAGMSFLSASLVIFMREKLLQGEDSPA